MPYNDHSILRDKHAPLSPSSYHWLNYDKEKLLSRYVNSYAQTIGTALHELAAQHIKYRMKIGKNNEAKKHILFFLLQSGIPRNVIDIDYVFENFVTYVNDAIGFRLEPEIILYYSDYCFGTTDAITPLEIVRKTNKLHIHDYKSGVTAAHMEQLMIYNALFCIEYGFKPEELDTELRIYQNNQIIVHQPESTDIREIMGKIIDNDKTISLFQEGNK